MSEWWRYWISDLVMYSARTWYRLVEHYNETFWPAHVVAILLGLCILGLILRPRSGAGRTISAILALLWAWVAVAWHLNHFESINWAARWFAVAFAIEATLLLWIGVIRQELTFRVRLSAAPRLGVALLLFAVLGYPFAAISAGRGAAQAEVFGMMPDPTALGTLGALMLAERRRWLMLIPLLWCLIGWGMLWYLR